VADAPRRFFINELIIVIAVTIIIEVITILGSYVINYDRYNNLAYAHFFGPNKTIDNYKLIFQVIPSILLLEKILHLISVSLIEIT